MTRSEGCCTHMSARQTQKHELIRDKRERGG